MKLSEDLQWRGLIKDKTFDDVTWLDEPKTFYLGVDCGSANSMTIGNLAIFLVARRLAEAGWKTVLLVGGATSLIGDPGGKGEERDLKSRKEIEYNIVGIKNQVQQLFNSIDVTLVDNYDWFKGIGYLEFLRDVGKHYSMTELVQRDFIASRMGEGGGGISYAEFSYSLIQGYDYWQLYKKYGVELQIGGSDQWGNILSGVPLVRKKEAKEVHAFSMPLVINKATGKKFGKSEAGAIWLDSQQTSPTQMYQFWVNVDDDAVEDYLKIYTFLSPEEVKTLMNTHSTSPAQRQAQTALAEAVTDIVHGSEETAIARQVTGILIGRVPLAEASQAVIDATRKEIYTAQVASDGSIIEALVLTGLATSNTDARRLIQGNAIALNGHKVSRESFKASDFVDGRLLIRKGKKFKDTALIELAVK